MKEYPNLHLSGDGAEKPIGQFFVNGQPVALVLGGFTFGARLEPPREPTLRELLDKHFGDTSPRLS